MLYRQDPNATMILTGISVGFKFGIGRGGRGASASG